MFGDLFGNLDEQTKALQEQLKGISVQAQAGDGAVQVTANANRVITNIAIDKSKLDLTDTEELEDLLIVAINEAIGLAAEKEAEASQKLIKDIMPPGMDGLFGRG